MGFPYMLYYAQMSPVQRFPSCHLYLEEQFYHIMDANHLLTPFYSSLWQLFP